MTYFKERDLNNLKRLERLKGMIPPFCGEFFLGIAQRTSTLTRVNYAYDLRMFFQFLTTEVEDFIDKKPADIKSEHLNVLTTQDVELYAQWLDRREDNGKSMANKPTTKMRKLATLRTFFAFLFKREKIDKNIMPNVDLPKLHERPITRLDKPEIKRVLETVAEGDGLTMGQQRFVKNTLRDQTIIIFFLTTGIRVSELVGLDTGDIDLKNASFKVTRKGGNQEILFMPEELQEQLATYIEHIGYEPSDKSTPLFKSLQGKRICVRAVQNLVKKYASIAVPLKKISPHKLRSTFGTNLYRATGDIYVVANVLGHRDVNTTKKHYAAITDDIRREAAKKVRLMDDE